MRTIGVNPLSLFGATLAFRILPVDMFHAVAQCVADVKMVRQSRVLESAHQIMGSIGDPVFCRTSGFLAGLINRILDISSFEAFSDVHAQHGDISMTQGLVLMLGGNTQYKKKFFLVDHDALINDVGILATLGCILLIDRQPEFVNPVDYGIVARGFPKASPMASSNIPMMDITVRSPLPVRT